MPDLTPNHPAVEAATPDIHSISLREYTPEDCHETIADALNAAIPHLTADDLRNTPAGRELIREGIAAARYLEWVQPRMTPGGHVFNPAIPGDELRAAREDILDREAMQNMRESEQGRALMAEAWDQGVADNERGWEHVYAGHDIDPDDPLAICQTCGTPNPYREGNE